MVTWWLRNVLRRTFDNREESAYLHEVLPQVREWDWDGQKDALGVILLESMKHITFNVFRVSCLLLKDFENLS